MPLFPPPPLDGDGAAAIIAPAIPPYSGSSGSSNVSSSAPHSNLNVVFLTRRFWRCSRSCCRATDAAADAASPPPGRRPPLREDGSAGEERAVADDVAPMLFASAVLSPRYALLMDASCDAVRWDS